MRKVKHITGLYPRLRVDTSRVSAVGQAGGVLLTETVRVSGLGSELSAALERWRKPTAIYDPAKVVLDLALTLALGGDCLADIALLRAEPGIYGRVASDPMVSRTIDALAADAEVAVKAIDTARAAARARVWTLAGDQAPDHGIDAAHPLIVDVDATLVGSHSEKENAKPTFKRGFGFHPLCVFVDHGALGTGGAVADRVAARERRLEHRPRPHRRGEGCTATAARPPGRDPAGPQSAGQGENDKPHLAPLLLWFGPTLLLMISRAFSGQWFN